MVLGGEGSDDGARAGGQAFLTACSVVEPDDWLDMRRTLPALRPDGWGALLGYAQEQGLAGLMARNLGWARAQLGLEVPILEKLEAARGAQLAQNLMRRAWARRVADALAGHGIPFIAVKGVVLAEEVYGDLSLRGFNDFDVMVPLERVEEAYLVLRRLGYTLTRLAHVSEFVGLGAHAAPMALREGSGVDLHWALGPDFDSAAARALVWEHARPAPEGAQLPGMRLSAEMSLIHLARHFHTGQYTILKPLVDLYVTARNHESTIDAAQLAGAARALGLAPVLEVAVALAERHLGVPVPAIERPRRWMPRIASRVVGRDVLLNAARRPRVDNWLRYLLGAGSLRRAAAGMREALLPGRLILAQFFNEPFRASLYPRYYWRQAIKVLTLSLK